MAKTTRAARTMKRADVLRILRANEPTPRRDYRVKALALVGSVTRDEAGPESDVDLLVEFDRGISLFHLVGTAQFPDCLRPAKSGQRGIAGRPHPVTSGQIRPAERRVLPGYQADSCFNARDLSENRQERPNRTANGWRAKESTQIRKGASFWRFTLASAAVSGEHKGSVDARRAFHPPGLANSRP